MRRSSPLLGVVGAALLLAAGCSDDGADPARSPPRRTSRISGVSSADALGPMQFLPSTWAACCTGDIEDPHDAILGAATYLVSKGARSRRGVRTAAWRRCTPKR